MIFFSFYVSWSQVEPMKAEHGGVECQNFHEPRMSENHGCFKAGD